MLQVNKKLLTKNERGSSCELRASQNPPPGTTSRRRGANSPLWQTTFALCLLMPAQLGSQPLGFTQSCSNTDRCTAESQPSEPNRFQFEYQDERFKAAIEYTWKS